MDLTLRTFRKNKFLHPVLLRQHQFYNKLNSNVNISRNHRFFSTNKQKQRKPKLGGFALYLGSVGVLAVGIAYAGVPLYKIFCQQTGFGGTTRQVTMEEARRRTVPVPNAKPITVKFIANTSDTLEWEFKPQQDSVKIVPGETALAFYTARNLTDKPIVGVASYNITPLKAGLYFNKVQCFCFDQQRLKPNEEVDMPVFFYIDPELVADRKTKNIQNIVLSYTFFKAKD